MSQMITKSGESLNKWISELMSTLYLRLGENVDNYNVICGEILALNKLLLKLGYHAELIVQIKENKN